MLTNSRIATVAARAVVRSVSLASPAASTASRGVTTAGEVVTARDAAVAGVWIRTSAKRDKLGELKLELNEGQKTLDDKATQEEYLDLYFADGIKLIAEVTDAGSDTKDDVDFDDDDNYFENRGILEEFSTWLDDQIDHCADVVNKAEAEAKFDIISAKLDSVLEKIPTDCCLPFIRDFLDPKFLEDETSSNLLEDDIFNMDKTLFKNAVSRFRLLLAKAAIDQVIESWKILTTVSDADIDRAAVEGISLQSEVDTLPLSKIFKFLQKVLSNSCSERVTAAWNLLDRDNDGLLDQAEMNEAVLLCLRVEQEALQALIQEALDARDVRAPLSTIGVDNQATTTQGWRQRRKERITKNKLIKMFIKSSKNHFDIEVETNHRLRCIYSWSNKADLDNQIKSVLVDDHGWSGRKRYVELSPKISESEFREVQEIHFAHLNRIGTEIVTSFREDLWVSQGKRRERRLLIRDSILFLTAVSSIDFVILML